MTYIEELAALTSGHPRGLTSAEIAEAIAHGKAPALASEIIRVCRTTGPFTAKHVGETLRVLRDFGGAPLVTGRTRDNRSAWRVEVSDAAVPSARPVGDAAEPRVAGDVVPGVGVARGGQRGDPRKDPTAHAHGAPDGFHLRGVSTLLNADGVPVAQWVKTAKDAETQRLEALFEAIKSLPDSFREAHEPVAAPEHCAEDLLCVYPVSDPHLAQLADAEETGNEYNLAIAERVHVEAIRKLVAVAPPARNALIVSLGDFFHCDNNSSRTARSGAQLDVDGRWHTAMRVGVRAMKAMIDAALEKHERVKLVCCLGNHDDQSSLMLALAMEAFYARDERVTVDTSPDPFHYHRFGKNLIGATHGDGTKFEDLPLLMAASRPEDWGATRHRYFLVGHVHHEKVRESPGCVVESFRTLAARDAWHHRSGYRSGRDMRVDVLHREHGRITRHLIGIERLGAEG